MSRFEGKLALVTGGRSGIGKACAEKFASEGARVITAQRGKDETFEHIGVDLLNPTAPEELITEVISRYGRLDILVNNAGLMREGTVLELKPKVPSLTSARLRDLDQIHDTQLIAHPRRDFTALRERLLLTTGRRGFVAMPSHQAGSTRNSTSISSKVLETRQRFGTKSATFIL